MAHPWSARPTIFSPLALILALGCGSGDSSPGAESDDAGVPSPDATPIDSGADVVDGGDGSCNPMDGAGCAGALACVYLPSIDDARCREVGASAVGETCDPTQTACIAGATCAQVEPRSTAACYETCRVGSACSGDAVCVAAEGSTSGYGLCLPVTPCNPVDDMCPTDEVCSLFEGAPVCLTAGEVARGASCASDNCARGSTCVFLPRTSGPICYEPCDERTACQTPDTRCATLEAGFGICVPRAATCEPLDDTCGTGRVCGLRGGILECGEVGNTPRGGDCSVMNCRRGSICLDVGDGATCYEPCRTAAPEVPCTAGACSGNVTVDDRDLGFGVCR